MTPEAAAGPITEPTLTPPSTAGMTTKVVKGSLWTLAGQVAPLAVSLVTTPFVIRMLGAESYGVLILIGLIPTYLGFADFGMGLASTKFASGAYAEGDLEKEARIVRTAALIALVSSTPFGLILFLFSSWITALFNVPEHLHAEASLALKLAAVTFVLNFLNNIFNTPQLTRLRMDLNTLVNAGFRVLGLIATPFAIYMQGIVGAVFVLMIASFLTLAAHIAASRKLDRYLLATSIERAVIGPMLKFGGALVGASVAAVVLVNAEKGILAATVSAATLAHYSVAFTLATMMTMFSTAMIQSLIPAFSQLQSPERRDQLNALYSRGIRLSLIWIIPALTFLGLLARPFFAIWAGPEFAEESTVPFYILLAGLAFNIPAYLPYTALMAAGRTDVFAKLYWIELVIYIFVVWGLSVRFGAVGAALAWSLRVVADAFIQFVLAKRFAGVKFRLRGYNSFFLGAAIMFIPAAGVIYFDNSVLAAIIVAVISLAIYCVIVFKKLLEVEEVRWIVARVTGRLTEHPSQ